MFTHVTVALTGSFDWLSVPKLYYIIYHKLLVLEKIKIYNLKYSFYLEKAMATPSSTLAWKIPWTEGPGGLQSMGSLGVGHD